METKMSAKSISIHSAKEFGSLLDGVQLSPFMKLKQSEELCALDAPNIDLTDLNISETLFCSFCNTGFVDKQQQRQHYKLDWHRYNLKQHLAQRKTVTEEKFLQLADDVSSISGSESESETETEQSSTDVDEKVKDRVNEERLNHLITRRSRILFNNTEGQVISIHRSLLLQKKEEPQSDEHLVELLKRLPTRNTWLLVMLGGGHFAAAIFKGNEAVLHKTFHCYTVRAKQGGSQSSKDNKGSHAKSAGASLRRYNEQSLIQHVQELMKAWGPDINRCDYIFYRAIGRGNTSVLFSGPNPPLLRSDPRVRNVPFTTRRPTFNEVKRVHALISSAFVYDSNEMFRVTFTPTKTDKGKETSAKTDEKTENKEKKESPKKIDRAKERPETVRELPGIVQKLAADESSSGSEGSFQMEYITEEIGFSDLKEFDDTVPQSMKKKRPKKKKKEIPSDKETLSPELLEFWKRVHTSCELGQIEELKTALENSGETITKEEAYSTLNQKNLEGQTILHKMSAEAKGDVVRLLLLHGGDPCIKDKKAQTPYDMCPDKTIRNIYRRFMGEFPDMYDYSKSHIPNALTEAIESEIAEKKKAARKVKRQKDKERKIANEAVKKEEDEKKRFLALSDREKRALAAERRILSTPGLKSTVLARCYLCAEDMTGKVPFEYDTFRFCSMPCLKAHRVNAKKQL